MLRRVDEDALALLVAMSYDGDGDLSRYHYSGDLAGDPASMAACTVRRIKDTGRHMELTHHAVYSGKTLIGYSTTAQEPAPMLFSFCIRKDYRTGPVLKGWLAALDALFGEDTWIVGLRDKNTRAISFFERNGFVKATHDPENKQYFLCRSA